MIKIIGIDSRREPSRNLVVETAALEEKCNKMFEYVTHSLIPFIDLELKFFGDPDRASKVIDISDIKLGLDLTPWEQVRNNMIMRFELLTENCDEPRNLAHSIASESEELELENPISLKIMSQLTKIATLRMELVKFLNQDLSSPLKVTEHLLNFKNKIIEVLNHGTTSQ